MNFTKIRLGLFTWLTCGAVILFAQQFRVSAGFLNERTGGLNNLGVRLGYHFNPSISAHLELRDRQVGFYNLATPCLILDPKVYPQLSALDLERERIALAPRLKGAAPLALAVTLSGRKRLAPFLTLRGEAVRYDFMAINYLEVIYARATNGLSEPLWISTERFEGKTSSWRMAGSVQGGFAFTSNHGRLTWRGYITADRYQTQNVEIRLPIAGYPQLKPLTIRLKDHFGGTRWGIGISAAFNFGKYRLE